MNRLLWLMVVVALPAMATPSIPVQRGEDAIGIHADTGSGWGAFLLVAPAAKYISMGTLSVEPLLYVRTEANGRSWLAQVGVQQQWTPSWFGARASAGVGPSVAFIGGPAVGARGHALVQALLLLGPARIGVGALLEPAVVIADNHATPRLDARLPLIIGGRIGPVGLFVDGSVGSSFGGSSRGALLAQLSVAASYEW
jgi:hypothetical protein